VVATPSRRRRHDKAGNVLIRNGFPYAFSWGVPLRLTIVQRFVVSLFVILCAVAAVTAVALDQPWLGLSLEPGQPEDAVIVGSVAPASPAGVVDPGSRLVAISSGAERVDIVALDRIEEPDAIESYEAYNDFMARQGRIASLIASGEIELLVESADGSSTTVVVLPETRRPLSSLPLAFWFQLGCAAVIAIIGAWVASIRRGDRQAALFAFAGYGASLSALSAAVYSTRELALPDKLFFSLSGLNHAGALIFAAFMIGLFTLYQKRIGLRWLFPACSVFLFGWWALNILQVLPGISVGFYLAVLLAMVVIAGLIGVQYFSTRGDLPARRALLWLGISVLIGAGAFTVLMALPILLGSQTALSQSYSFGFFPLIYLGVALGLTRYRLFDLDRWAFDVLSYVLAVLLFVAIDALLVSMLALNFEASLGLTAIVVGLFYLPLRNWASVRLLGVGEIDPYDLFRSSAEIALQQTREERAARWEQTLVGFFEPLTIERDVGNASTSPAIADEGRALDVPAYAWSDPLRLVHLHKGRKLFGGPHVRLVEQLSFLVMEAERSRQAYDLGVREERSRIARDLHDNVGAMLLSSLRAREASSARDQVRGALSDIREIVNGLSERNETLAHIVAHLRAETMERLHGIDVDWPEGDADHAMIVLPYSIYRHFTSAHRELVSNVIRHGQAHSVSIRTALKEGWLIHRLENNLGPAADRQTDSRGGNGIVNLKRRAAELGGCFVFDRGTAKATAEIRLPLKTVAINLGGAL
jgi:signal transduction histidine kinase